MASWPGLTRPSILQTTLVPQCSPIQPLKKIFPIRIHLVDQSEFPRAGPMFQVLFALQRIPNVIMGLVINETIQAITLGETVDDAFAVLQPRRNRLLATPM
jgi:hypothetical protein